MVNDLIRVRSMHNSRCILQIGCWIDWQGMSLLLYWKRVNDIAADPYVLTILHHYMEFTQNLARPPLRIVFIVVLFFFFLIMLCSNGQDIIIIGNANIFFCNTRQIYSDNISVVCILYINFRKCHLTKFYRLQELIEKIIKYRVRWKKVININRQ